MKAKLQRYPKALPYLFLTEMWERYGFYVVQGMLVLYMTKAFGFSDDESYTISGVFSALAYTAPMLGGMLADRYLGFNKAITWGGILLCIGYGLMALPSKDSFYLALATIVVGNGLFKPNISSLLGALYKPADPDREVGFTIFYIGINLGILMAGIFSGILKAYFGWYAAFGSASIGLIMGIFTFFAGIKWGNMKHRSYLVKHKKIWARDPFLITYCLLSITVIRFLLQSSALSKWLLPCIGMVFLFFIFFLAFRQNETYRKRMLLLNILIVSAVIFWMIHLQMLFSATLFIDRLVDRHVFNITLPTTAFYPLEGLFIILLGPAFAWSWQNLSQNNKNPSPLIKFVFGIAFAGLGYLVLGLSTYFAGSNHLVSPLWPLLMYLFITIGELLLSPIGLSAVTLLSPPQLTGMMMGIWFIALGFGGQFAGMLAEIASIPDALLNQPNLQLLIYRNAFFDYAWLGFGIATLLFFIQWFLKRLLEE
jgi:proton-dependent oligopeptide transporter, POT family